MTDSLEPQRAWHVASRLTELRGEERATYVRLVGLALFYGIEVLNRHGLALGPLSIPALEGISDAFHVAMTLVALASAVMSAAVLLALRSQVFPPALKFGTTGVDLVLASIALTIADGPRSPLVVIYFPIVALSLLRASSSLVRFATGGAVVSYLGMSLVRARLVPHEDAAPVYQQALFVIALVLTGFVLDHVVRESRRTADVFAERTRTSTPPRGEASSTEESA